MGLPVSGVPAACSFSRKKIRRILGRGLKHARDSHAPLVTTLLQLEFAEVAETDAERLQLLASTRATAESLGIRAIDG